MKTVFNKKKLISLPIMGIAAIMFSQKTPSDSTKLKNLDELVITGNSNPKASILTSTSISTLKVKEILNAAPRTTAEIFRTIPGIRAESSGGEGNSNITVRGVPVSAGGSRYMLIQEDGLPVLQFGDISFATQDQFLRFDSSINRVEALRGGSASIYASNSPAGIINFISNTGEKTGGSLTQQVGLNFKNYRTDFNYGTSIGNRTFINVGGFFRSGDGPRKTGFTSNLGGQFKVSLMKRFENGYFRIYSKILDDRAAAYMPMPIKITGTDDSPKYESINNYNLLTGSMQTNNYLKDRTLGTDGNILDSDISDGMHSLSKSIGAEFSMDLGEGWKVENKGRYSINNGQFLAPFPANVGNAASIITSIPGYASATYVGTNTAIDQSANANYISMHLFNTKLNNFNNFFNNFNLSKKWDGLKANLGLYKGIQNLSMAWHWNTYLQEVSDNNARLIDVKNAAGQLLTNNGVLAYGVPAWGNCCSRNYDTKYDVTAPYANMEITAIENLTIDGGIRMDIGNVTGSFSGGTGSTVTKDMNGNGTIDINEQNVATISTSNSTPVNYKYDILSYSVGANYAINSSNAVFARMSSGGSASADRILFNAVSAGNPNGYAYSNTDDKALSAVKVNKVSQAEAGYKLRGKNFNVNTTFFLANTIESNYEATTQKTFDNTYKSLGLEFDAFVKLNNNFDIRGGITYTNAKIKEAKDKTVIDNTPRRTPSIMYTINPNYSINNLSVGMYILGVSSSYTQDNNILKMNAYALVNPYISYQLRKNMSISLNANNLLNAVGLTEAEEDKIPTNGIVRARPLPGRSVSMSFRFDL